jgi:hypothetical protein
LISDETNRKISDRAPAGYLDDPGIVSTDRAAELLAPHFIGDTTTPLMQSATEMLSDTEAAALYEKFLQAREAAMIAEIRRVCGISPISLIAAEPESADELAPDVAAREESDDESSDEVAFPAPLTLTPLNEARQGLFAEILEGVNAKRPAIRVPARNRDSWVTFASGPFGGWSIAQINDGRIRVEAYLDCGDRDRNKALFDELEGNRADWEGKVGFELTFERLDDKQACRIAAHYAAVDLRADLELGQRRQIVDWGVASLVAMIDTLNLHLRERAKALRGHVPPAGSFTDAAEVADLGPHAESSFVDRL